MSGDRAEGPDLRNLNGIEPTLDSTLSSTLAEHTDLQISRKREREISLEPQTPKSEAIDIDAGRVDKKEIRTPAKKNRVHLDGTAEEDDSSGSLSPPLGTSPPHEIKVRQISQGVEDINWRNKMTSPAQNDRQEEPDAELDVGIDDLDSDSETDAMISTNVLPLHSAPADTQVEDLDLPPPRNESSRTMEVHHDEPASTQVSGMDIHHDEPPATQLSEMETRPDLTHTANGLPNNLPTSRRGSESDGDKEKGLKRKLGDRAISFGPNDSAAAIKVTASLEPLKRLREDSEKSTDSQEVQEPSPPPETSLESKQVSTSSAASKFGGFIAYASTSSPFASVKGQNVFSSGRDKPASSAHPTIKSPTPSSPSSFSAVLGEASPSAFTSKESAATSSSFSKRTGFEAFSGSSSPFASASRSKSPSSVTSGLWPHRSKSPTRRAHTASANAFSSYATGMQGFTAPAPKRARAASPNGGSSRGSLERTSTVTTLDANESDDGGGRESDQTDKHASFGDKLRAGKDDLDEGRSDEEQGKVSLTEQEIETGEEDEELIYQVRGKLFTLSPENQWKERGTGNLRLNIRRSDGAGARLIMRKEAVHTVLLNVTLFTGMRCFLSPDPRYIRFSAIESGQTTHYNLRVSNAKVAEDLLEQINSNIPP